MLDERFWNLELVTANELGQQLIFGFALCRVAPFVLHAFPNTCAYVIQCRKFTEFFSEIVIQLGQGFLLNCNYLDFVAEGLAAQALVGKIFWVMHVEYSFLACT